MTLTLFSDYSLRVLMFAAVKSSESFSIEEVAGAYGLPRHHVGKIITFLVQKGYLNAQRGRGGGITLGKPPGEIRVGALIRETESGAPLVECFEQATNTCPLCGVCSLQGALRQAWEAFFQSLDKHTLADLTRKPAILRERLALTA